MLNGYWKKLHLDVKSSVMCCSIIFYSLIIGGEEVSKWQVPDGVKMAAQIYIEFFKATAKSGAFRKIIFICDKTVADLHKNRFHR